MNTFAVRCYICFQAISSRITISKEARRQSKELQSSLYMVHNGWIEENARWEYWWYGRGIIIIFLVECRKVCRPRSSRRVWRRIYIYFGLECALILRNQWTRIFRDIFVSEVVLSCGKVHFNIDWGERFWIGPGYECIYIAEKHIYWIISWCLIDIWINKDKCSLEIFKRLVIAF